MILRAEKLAKVRHDVVQLANWNSFLSCNVICRHQVEEYIRYGISVCVLPGIHRHHQIRSQLDRLPITSVAIGDFFAGGCLETFAGVRDTGVHLIECGEIIHILGGFLPGEAGHQFVDIVGDIVHLVGKRMHVLVNLGRRNCDGGGGSLGLLKDIPQYIKIVLGHEDSGLIESVVAHVGDLVSLFNRVVIGLGSCLRWLTIAVLTNEGSEGAIQRWEDMPLILVLITPHETSTSLRLIFVRTSTHTTNY